MKKAIITIAIVLVVLGTLTGVIFGVFGENINPTQSYTIKFESNGGTAIENATYKVGDIVKSPAKPEKKGYEFAGWYLDEELTKIYIFSVMGDKDITLYAKWIQKYYTITYVGNGGTGAAPDTTYDGSREIVLPTDWIYEGHRFAGWYENADFTSNVVTKITKGTKGDKTFYAKWVEAEADTHIVTLNGNGGTGTMLDSFKASEGAVLPTDWVREGYTFAGWYDDAEFKGAKVTDIPKNTKHDVTLYARWMPNNYRIIYHTNGGGALMDTVVPCGESIALEEPTLSGKIFDGWYMDSALTHKFNLDKMPAHDIEVYAKWVTARELKYYSDGVVQLTVPVKSTGNTVIDPIDYKWNKPDYFFDGWYKDSACTEKYDASQPINTSMSLYAKWTHRSFMPYMGRFSGGGSEKHPIMIYNEREAIALFDYIMFTGRAKTVFTLQYARTAKALDDAINSVIKKATNNIITTANISTATDGSYATIEIPSTSLVDNYKEYTPHKSVPKMLNALVPVAPKTRSASFDEFKYKEYEKSLNVETSNQLFYALQYGIRPVVKAGSSADKMLTKAKNVLREICDDKMSDFDKLYAIFCWINQNVTYDNAAAHRAITDKTFVANEYNSWHLEGIFDDGYGVCDAIAKAVTVLARIEGIPCVRVTGISHAWNKVYIDLDRNGIREWFNLDATWGNGSISDGTPAEQYDTTHIIGEAIDNEQFLFNDDFVTSGQRHIPDNHLDIKAKTIGVDAFRDMSYTVGTKEYDLVIQRGEISDLAKKVHDFVNAKKVKKGSYVVISVKQDTSGSAEQFAKDIMKAVSVENNRKIGDIDVSGVSRVPGEYSIRIMFEI